MAATAIMEMENNLGYFVHEIKLDYSDAFPTNGQPAEDINEITAAAEREVSWELVKEVFEELKSEGLQIDEGRLQSAEWWGQKIGKLDSGTRVAVCLLIVYGYYTFGRRDAPGIWEVSASAPSAAASSMEWPDPELDGATVPKNNRMVDDTVHIVACRGRRQQRYIESFKKLMSWVAGTTSNNEEKEAESGGYTFHQHTFGDLMDTAREHMKTPFSRLCRGEDVIIEYLNDRNRRLTAAEVPKVRGKLAANFRNAPQLDFFLPRLDAMSSDAAKKFGEHPPPEYEPSAAMGDETKEEGEAMNRALIEIAWRLGTIDQGKYMYKTFDQCLDPAARDALPHRKQNKKVFLESDCSGDGYYWFNPQTGEESVWWWNEVEREYFNSMKLLITNGEMAPVVESAPFLLLAHPGVGRFVPRMDNANVATALEKHTTTNAHNLEGLISLGVLSWWYGATFEELYVKSKDNLRADPGSRKKLSELYLAEKKRWEETNSKTVRTQTVPAAWRDRTAWFANSKEWTPQRKVEAILKKLLHMIEYMEARGASEHARVPSEKIKACLNAMLNQDPIPLLDRSTEDIPEKAGP